MKKVLTKITKFAVHVFDSMIPDEETARRIGERYVRMNSLTPIKH